MESARINRLLQSIRCQEISEAIKRQNPAACCNPSVVESATIVPPESAVENAKSDVNLWGIVFPKATVINGTTVGLESTRLTKENQRTIDCSTKYNDPEARFSMYRPPYVTPVCPPIPSYILNGNMPKGSTIIPCGIQRFQGTIPRDC
jgi:hypothetical protein